MHFRLIPRSTALDDPQLLVEIFSEFRTISLIWEATTATRMKTDSYCQQQIVAH